jgi:hypothetical protein
MANQPDDRMLVKTAADRAREETSEDQRTAKRQRNLQFGFNAALTAASIVTLVVVLYQNHVLSESLAEMRKQTDSLVESVEETRRQADIAQGQLDEAKAARTLAESSTSSTLEQAKKALDATIELARMDQRAWFGRTTFNSPTLEAGKRFEVLVQFRNSGSSPALNVHVISNLEPVVDRALPTFKFGEPDYDSFDTVQPSTGVNLGLVYRRRAQPILDDAVVDLIKSGRITIYVYGVACYEDIFSAVHWSTFCNRYNPTRGTFVACDTWNDVDREGGPKRPAACEAN